jgi:hypothetical protein
MYDPGSESTRPTNGDYSMENLSRENSEQIFLFVLPAHLGEFTY